MAKNPEIRRHWLIYRQSSDSVCLFLEMAAARCGLNWSAPSPPVQCAASCNYTHSHVIGSHFFIQRQPPFNRKHGQIYADALSFWTFNICQRLMSSHVSLFLKKSALISHILCFQIRRCDLLLKLTVSSNLLLLYSLFHHFTLHIWSPNRVLNFCEF